MTHVFRWSVAPSPGPLNHRYFPERAKLIFIAEHAHDALRLPVRAVPVRFRAAQTIQVELVRFVHQFQNPAVFWRRTKVEGNRGIGLREKILRNGTIFGQTPELGAFANAFQPQTILRGNPLAAA